MGKGEKREGMEGERYDQVVERRRVARREEGREEGRRRGILREERCGGGEGREKGLKRWRG